MSRHGKLLKPKKNNVCKKLLLRVKNTCFCTNLVFDVLRFNHLLRKHFPHSQLFWQCFFETFIMPYFEKVRYWDSAVCQHHIMNQAWGTRRGQMAFYNIQQNIKETGFLPPPLNILLSVAHFWLFLHIWTKSSFQEISLKEPHSSTEIIQPPLQPKHPLVKF